MSIRDVLIDGAVLSLLASLYLMAVLWFNPRLFLQDYPALIQAAVPPKTEEEKRLSLILGLPFLVLLLVAPLLSTLAFVRGSGGAVPFLDTFLHAFGVIFAFNVVDWLLLDWLVLHHHARVPGHPRQRGHGSLQRLSLPLQGLFRGHPVLAGRRPARCSCCVLVGGALRSLAVRG